LSGFFDNSCFCWLLHALYFLSYFVGWQILLRIDVNCSLKHPVWIESVKSAFLSVYSCSVRFPHRKSRWQEGEASFEFLKIRRGKPTQKTIFFSSFWFAATGESLIFNSCDLRTGQAPHNNSSLPLTAVFEDHKLLVEALHITQATQKKSNNSFSGLGNRRPGGPALQRFEGKSLHHGDESSEISDRTKFIGDSTEMPC